MRTPFAPRTTRTRSPGSTCCRRRSTTVMLRPSSSPPPGPSRARVLGRVCGVYPWLHRWEEKARPRAFHTERDPVIAVRARWGFARDKLLGIVETRRWLNHDTRIGCADCALVARLCPSVTAVTSACGQHAREGGSDFAGLHRLLKDLVDACRRCTFAHHGADVAAD